MNPVEYTTAAFADLNGIWDYTADKWGLHQAERYLLDIRKACEDAAAGLRTGRPYPAKPGFSRLLVGQHVVFYVEQRGGIRVMRVLHQRMDVEGRLSG